MSPFDDGGLPPELSDVAHQLRSHRYEASALELDQTKARILKRAGGQRVARGGRMRKRSLLTAVIMVVAIGTGSSAALAVGGLTPFSRIFASRPAAHRIVAPQSAALSQYGCPAVPPFYNFACLLITEHINAVEQRVPALTPILDAVGSRIQALFRFLANRFFTFHL